MPRPIGRNFLQSTINPISFKKFRNISNRKFFTFYSRSISFFSKFFLFQSWSSLDRPILDLCTVVRREKRKSSTRSSHTIWYLIRDRQTIDDRSNMITIDKRSPSISNAVTMMIMNHANHDNNQWREKTTATTTTTTIMRDKEFSGSTINAPMNFRSTSCRIRTILCVVQTDSDVFHIVRSFPVNNIYEHPSIPIVMLQNSFCAFLRTFEIVVSKLIIHRLDLSKKCVFLIKRIKRESLDQETRWSIIFLGTISINLLSNRYRPIGQTDPFWIILFISLAISISFRKSIRFYPNLNEEENFTGFRRESKDFSSVCDRYSDRVENSPWYLHISCSFLMLYIIDVSRDILHATLWDGRKNRSLALEIRI